MCHTDVVLVDDDDCVKANECGWWGGLVIINEKKNHKKENVIYYIKCWRYKKNNGKIKGWNKILMRIWFKLWMYECVSILLVYMYRSMWLWGCGIMCIVVEVNEIRFYPCSWDYYISFDDTLKRVFMWENFFFAIIFLVSGMNM